MISVCMATHNGAKYIKEQLDSILPQLSFEDEIIISDDGSSDSTLKIIDDYKDCRLKVFNYKHDRKYKINNIYAAHNFENALLNAKGDIIFLADQDDVWFDNKVVECKEALKEYDLVIHNLLNTDTEMNPISLHFVNGFRWKNIFMKSNSYHGCAMAFRKEVLNYSLPFPSYLPLHDYWIGFLTELKGKVIYIDKPLMYYRLHENNISTHNNHSLFYKIKHRFYIALHLYKRFLFT